MTTSLKYYFSLVCIFLLLNAITILFANHYLVEKGSVRIRVMYHSFAKEDLSLYWNNGKGFSEKNFNTWNTQIGTHTYEFQITHIDSLTEIRIDPDNHFNVAILQEIIFDGLSHPIKLSSFESSKLNGIYADHTKDQSVLKRKETNTDPYLVISIPSQAKSVSQDYSLKDIFILCFCFICSLTCLILIRGRIKATLQAHSLTQIGTIIIFLFITSIYWSNEYLQFYISPPSIENRTLSKKPNLDSLVFQPKKYFNAYSNWFIDHFAFKQNLVYLNSYLKIKVFNTSPMPDKMFIGQNFEFFPANSLFSDDITGKRRLSQEELTSLFANNLLKQNILAKQNIYFYLTVPPIKQSINEELLPNHLLLQKKCCKMAEQFSKEVENQKANFYIDIISLLKERHYAFPKQRLFYQFDLHWNEWAAFLAYRKLIARIQQDHPWVGNPLSENEITLDTVYTEDADLAKLILMNKLYKNEKILIQSKSDTIVETIINGVYQVPIYKYTNKRAKGKVLVFRDSYSEQWKWLIARHFNESVFIWDQHITQKLINEYKPDIVIQENCEMFLFNLFNPMSTDE